MRSKKHNIAVEEGSLEEIRRYAKWALERAGTEQRLPTKVEDIVASANLAVAEDISLAQVHHSFFSKTYGILASALAKLRALVDLNEDLIYLDLSMSQHQVNFATLHECGHKTLPWQRTAYRYEDDDHTLSSEVEVQFEREANQFAAEVLFQLDRFTREASDYPLNIRTPLSLSKKYGASCHATIRRYVERHRNECAVLVCRASKLLDDEPPTLEVEHIVYSDSFRNRYGKLRFPRNLAPDHTFSRLVFEERVRVFESGSIELEDGNADGFQANFHIFNSTYRVFVLVFPRKPSRGRWTKIIRL